MPALDDYLTKQLFIEKNVVTYRSLSRQLGIHVNAAKTELSKFHETSVDSPTRAFATYLVSGELFPTAPQTQDSTSTQTEDGMDVDSEPTESQSTEEEVPTTTLTLVGEQDLEHAKSTYARIFSVHVYCLSPSPLTDAGLICDPSAIVYKADAKDAPTSSIALGRVVGPDVRIGKALPPVASSSKAAAESISRKPTLKVKTEKPEDKTPVTKSGSASISSAEKEKDKANVSAAKPKATGKLDWSKAKKTPESDKSKKKEKEVKKEESVSPVEKAVKKTAKLEINDESPKDDGKRGVKRKVAPPAVSDAEDKPTPRAKEKEKKSTPVPAPADIKLRKNRIVSDDEEDTPPPPRRITKTKARSSMAADALDSDAENSLRAMMDIDDALVEKASSSRPVPVKPEPADDEDEDVEMAPEPAAETQQASEDEDAAPKPKPRKKAQKKVVPVGRNGLKKKRIMKSRMTVDAKGYMVTEDYSSYESVDEEEAEEAAPKKGKGKKASTSTSSSAAKAKKPASIDVDASDAEEPVVKKKPVARAPSTTKTKKQPAAAQGSLKDFFGKPKK
ncbi:uncharacterized protein TRAVEDRAFT_44661 [Trametes versicolor FP-101664 SS1]|uniref:uncharacterized protein n=1 Tax=Trametes versicolor (strain FP-101664) TaxID=717944 RepID=UPI0004622144|nr:uncharacterized protein TRAVEDRAFT_44661 [Trametes versicolor FP-101664 SS1]EIW61840.1 hypothetical protein TRAVEDRAFT_44661 [Trametes versicolor FP-101664 SS1]